MRGVGSMMDTKLLLQKIAALRTRLDADVAPRALEQKVQQSATHNRLIETALNPADPGETSGSEAGAMRLSARGARLLRKGRESLAALRAIAEDAVFQDMPQGDALESQHREGIAMLEVMLRTVQAFPASMSMQLRLCDGLEVILAEVDQRLAQVNARLTLRKQVNARIDTLAEYLRSLAAMQPVGLTPLQALADSVIAQAQAGEPLAFLSASPVDPARFAAAHSLTVAHVLARLLHDDAEWQPQLQLAIMAALVHDVGMARVPAEVLLTEGPLDSEERRLIEKHTIVCEAMLDRLWPGGGWPVDAACSHHERNDGTGYPLGRSDLQLSAFVRILAVCDVYAALCAPRPHRPAFDTRTALTETLLLAERDYLDRNAAERLLRLSFYPVGSTVEMSDGAVGIVAATNGPPDRPIVHLLRDAQGLPLTCPMLVDLRDKKDRSIVRGLNADDQRKCLRSPFLTY
jgi:HD-GYP domain-containing protein (c-di-GMP phosphodiesterase class II)